MQSLEKPGGGLHKLRSSELGNGKCENRNNRKCLLGFSHVFVANGAWYFPEKKEVADRVGKKAA